MPFKRRQLGCRPESDGASKRNKREGRRAYFPGSQHDSSRKEKKKGEDGEATPGSKGFGLIDGELVAIDGTKLKANCSKKQHYNANIVSAKLEYIDGKINAYLRDFLVEDNRQKNRTSLKS